MFTDAARLYWKAKCQVGHGSSVETTKLFGLGCLIAPQFVLTARHVIGDRGTCVLLGDGLWNCRLAGEWRSRDLALLKVTSVAKQLGPGDLTSGPFPSLATAKPSLGQTLGYLAWLSLRHESGLSSGYTYFGQGHVAFFTENEAGELVFALAGGAIQKGFSGGPVFTSSGELTGVLVEALQYVPDLAHPASGANVVAVLAPVAPIASEISSIVARGA